LNDRRRYSLLQIPDLGRRIHDLPRFDTSDFRFVRRPARSTREPTPIDRSAETLLLVIEGSFTVVWCEATRKSPAVELLLAGAEGATFVAMVRRS
jgi:hypothetical protein